METRKLEGEHANKDGNQEFKLKNRRSLPSIIGVRRHEIINNAAEEPQAKRPNWNTDNDDIAKDETVFMKNVPRTATDDDLHNCFSEFDELEYGLIVNNQTTNHSAGTTYTKFINKEDEDKCLNASAEVEIKRNILEYDFAVRNQDMERITAELFKTAENDDLPVEIDNENKPALNRNLHLLNEGGFLPNTVLAASVPHEDMQLRQSIDRERQLRAESDPDLIVSDRTLVFYNLPPDYTDRKFLAMCKKYGVNISKNKGKGKKRTEGNARAAKVMKNHDPEKSSKCYAYMICETHEVALHLLRAANNNPNSFGPPFSPDRRPVVYFSLEDR